RLQNILFELCHKFTKPQCGTGCNVTQCFKHLNVEAQRRNEIVLFCSKPGAGGESTSLLRWLRGLVERGGHSVLLPLVWSQARGRGIFAARYWGLMMSRF